MKKPRVVVAGQIPPPYGGQNIMIQKAIAQFAALPECETIHLPFFFTPDFQEARKAGFGKALELFRVILRLLRIRSRGPIDLFLYPTGGPQTVPIVRDILLLPLILLCSRRVVLHFHAAGVADRFQSQRRHPLCLLLSAVYQKAAAAVVMAEFNRRDPEFFGIKEVIVRPHKIPDEFDAGLAARSRSGTSTRLLYVGHLHPDKGTDALLRAFAALRKEHPDITLELVGECLPPWSRMNVAALIDELDIKAHITLSGVLTGAAKWEAFSRADLFVFPTTAPYESFGLVLIEAMMSKLPIVATDWRGNREVITPDAGGIIFPADLPLEKSLQRALESALSQRDSWSDWGSKNRNIFEERYAEAAGELWLAQAVVPFF